MSLSILVSLESFSTFIYIFIFTVIWKELKSVDIYLPDKTIINANSLNVNFVQKIGQPNVLEV